MAIDPSDLADLKEATLTGRPPACEYLKVTWDTGVINYYGGAPYQDGAPFTSIGVTVEPRLIYPDKKDPFHEIEVNPDLRTDEVTVTFDDIDKEITGLFQTYGSGVTCEFIYYYPDQDITTTVWSGQLQAPKVYGWKQVKAVATNGYKSRELVVPSGIKPKECRFIFAGLLPDTDTRRSSGCYYDPPNGQGVYKTGTTEHSDCPRNEDACNARMGTSDGRYFGGFRTDAVTIDGGSGYMAVSKGNNSALKDPIRVVFGATHIRNLPLLLWRRDGVGNNGFVSTIWEVCEGPITSVSNFKINELLIASTGGTFGNGNMQTRLGTRGQPRTTYAPNVAQFSSTAIVFADYGRVNPANYSPSNLSAECDVVGFAEVCVYNDDSPIAKTRQWSDNRVWCLLELYKNQKFGLGYAESLFEILDWMTEATWSDVVVSHTVTPKDNTDPAVTYTSRRSTFNAILEGKSLGEQVENIARTGGLSVPFLHESKYTISSFRKATSDELTDAPVFYDTGSNVNVVWSGQPVIELSQTPDNKLTNKVEIRFEEASNNGTERVFYIDDTNAQLKAGRQQGTDTFTAVPKTFNAFGVTTFAEAARFGYRMLWFGEWDEGGTQNNLRLTLTVPFEQVLGIKRYSIIKVVSQILDGFTVGTDDGVTDLTETPEYFRVLKIQRKSGGKAEITAQVYNHTAYTAFEVDAGGTSVSSNPAVVYGADNMIEVNGSYEYVGQLNSKPSYAYGSNEIQWSSSKWRLYNNGTQVYESSSAVAFPWLASWTTTTPDGVDPAPSVYEGEPINIPVDDVTLTATYDDTEGKFVIDIA